MGRRGRRENGLPSRRAKAVSVTLCTISINGLGRRDELRDGGAIVICSAVPSEIQVPSFIVGHHPINMSDR